MADAFGSDSCVISHVCKENEEGCTVSWLLRERLKLFSGTYKSLKYGGGIRVNGCNVRVGHKLRCGDVVSLDFNCNPESRMPDIDATPMELDILLEDDAFIVVNKKPDCVIHPTALHQGDTLTNGIVHYWQTRGVCSGIHIVGRLDNGTSGIVVIARNGYVQECMRRQSHDGVYTKIYHGIASIGAHASYSSSSVDGECESFDVGYEGVIDKPIGRTPNSIMERCITEDGSPSVTHYKVLAVDSKRELALMEFKLETGRTHQIRVHCASCGFPLLGDTLYGAESPLIAHQALHAAQVHFTHPITHEPVDICAPYPEDMANVVAKYFN